MKKMTNKDIQDVSLEILKDIHEFCEENNIYYILCGGCLIGAIRHNGFIPWDDDIDLAFPRPDYERFINSYKSKRGYKIFSREIEGGDGVYLAFSRVCDMDKTYVDASLNPWSQYETGVWIDIMPLEGAYADEDLERKRWKRANATWRKSVWYRFSKLDFSRLKELSVVLPKAKWARFSFMDSHLFRFVYIFIKVVFCKFFFRKGSNYTDFLIKICKECDFNKSDYYTDLAITHYGMREYNPKSYLGKRILFKFEDSQFYVPSGYDGWLRHIYGDYMKLPPKEDQIHKHEVNNYYWK